LSPVRRDCLSGVRGLSATPSSKSIALVTGGDENGLAEGLLALLALNGPPIDPLALRDDDAASSAVVIPNWLNVDGPNDMRDGPNGGAVKSVMGVTP
jgi:hypothetical protein